MNKIKSGFFAITEVLNSTRHVEYNWWHSSDHQPENLAIDGIVYARRWAAPQKLMDARVAVHQAIERHQYLAHYMFTEPLDEAITAFHELGSWCRNNNRFFEGPQHSQLRLPPVHQRVRRSWNRGVSGRPALPPSSRGLRRHETRPRHQRSPGDGQMAGRGPYAGCPWS